MAIKKFLENLLETQVLEQDELDILISRRDEVEAVLRDTFGVDPIVKHGGSKAKNTMIQESYDLDIVCYFLSDSEKTLKDIYEETSTALKTKYYVEEKKSAIRIIKSRDTGDIIDFHIDVVPGKFINEDNEDCFLYQNIDERYRLQTNIKKHISFVKDSGQVEIIKLAKLWKKRWGLEFKTFVLEVFIVNKITGQAPLQSRFKNFLQKVVDEIEECRLVDPANTANVVSELLNAQEKTFIKNKAKECVDLIEDGELSSWHEIFDESFTESEEVVGNNNLIVLSDASHQVVPPWPIRTGKVAISAETFAKIGESNVSLNKLKSDSGILPKETWIRFVADTNITSPFEVYWQVVNTGQEAREKQKLRGNLEAGGLTREEVTGYRGKHFVLCHVVKNGERTTSNPFYINVGSQILKLGKRKFKGPRFR